MADSKTTVCDQALCYVTCTHIFSYNNAIKWVELLPPFFRWEN